MLIMTALTCPYRNKKIALATKHDKERVLKPLLDEQLNVTVFTAAIDTDLLGTFTGETERSNDPFTTAMKKCEMAHQLTGEALCLASEGSFGPHPQIGFIAADEELLVLRDFENNHFVRVKNISTKTNFNAGECYNIEEVLSFAANALFPSHALIIQSDKNNFENIYKGIVNKEELISIADQFLTQNGKLFVQTDMRAKFNPTRMEVIKEAGKKLISAIYHTCKRCQLPGMELTGFKAGLPCSLCNAPTKTPIHFVYSCNKCGYEEIKSNEKVSEEPMFCEVCNP